MPPRRPDGGGAFGGKPDIVFDYTIFYTAHGGNWRSIEHMRACLSNLEWNEHAAYLRYRAEEDEAAMKRAQRGSRGRR